MPLLHQLKWHRRDQPILSGMTTKQAWCQVQLYNPTVLKLNGTYKMWYVGGGTMTRTDDMNLGYAESNDGLHWTEHAQNPILTDQDLPFGRAWQTPHVMFDPSLQLYRMWFVMSSGGNKEPKETPLFSKLGYATSKDGIKWDVHPQSLFDDVRRPCVLKTDHGYQMWMGSKPSNPPDSEDPKATCKNIYRFESTDGLSWQRDALPAVTTREHCILVYPFVLRNESGYTMWYGRTASSTVFEVYCSTSTDGVNWTHHYDKAALPATRDPATFDSRYISTPCILDDGDRFLMYYSARDSGQLYGAGDGTIQSDTAGIYRHIGVAVCEK